MKERRIRTFGSFARTSKERCFQAAAALEILGNAAHALVQAGLISQEQLEQAVFESGTTARRSRFLRREARRLGLPELKRATLLNSAVFPTHRLITAVPSEEGLIR
ncbi:hypothetical protein HY025_02355 [Candidatus Daviesbacteria bacterium]|nr:hypothetical protein [Candidatus Daviesbacteria bacterium]